MSLQHLSISRIFQLLLTRFGPNFKCRFLGTSLTDVNCDGNICPGNICPWQEYLSYYWPNFDQTFWTQFFGGLNFFLINILLDPNFFDPKCFWTICWAEYFIDPKQFLDLHYFAPKLFRLFGPTVFLEQNSFYPKFF